MNITLRQLRAFVAVADSGSFTRAAENLHLSQSALSGLIKELEQNLDVKLFDRTTRQLCLSAGGVHLLPQARRILMETQALASELHHLTNHQQGKVRLAVSQQLAASAMPAILAAFAKQYPDIYINLIDCNVEQVLQRVQNNEADFGIGPERPYGNDVDSDLLFTSPFYLVMPQNHPLSQKNIVTWQDLRQSPLITLTGSFTDHLAADLPEQDAEYLMHSAYRVNFLSTALGMAKVGLGLTFCLPYAAEWVQQHGLVMRPLEQPKVSRCFYIYQQRHRSLSPAATTLKAFLKGEEAQRYFNQISF
ncbi:MULTISPECIES: LysR family transcriptional regulator [unclassified Acinetobacter]|uniref:LysR family transcriptional regulator n=1 Tax=unclassified Acinetobacter TaxID=196816 RepID=UPI0035B6FF0C